MRKILYWSTGMITHSKGERTDVYMIFQFVIITDYPVGFRLFEPVVRRLLTFLVLMIFCSYNISSSLCSDKRVREVYLIEYESD